MEFNPRDWASLMKRAAASGSGRDDGEGEDSGEDEDEDGDGIVDSEIVEVGNALWKHHVLLYNIFDCFASMDAKNGISSVTCRSGGLQACTPGWGGR